MAIARGASARVLALADMLPRAARPAPTCSLCRPAASSSARGIATSPRRQQHAAQATPPPPPPAPRPRPSEADVGAKMRSVLRNVAQPVVVAVARSDSSSSSTYHGATLTSFASLTLEPHPLVAFSLRLPSRMADLLRLSEGDSPRTVAVSLLSHENQGVADALAKPGAEQGPIFARPDWTAADPPALKTAVGSLTCEVVRSLPLRDVGGPTDPSDPHGSELFICRVLDASDGAGADSLVHYRREYHAVSGEERRGDRA